MKVAHATAIVTVDELRGQGRPRFAHGRAYKAAADHLYEQAIREQFIDQIGDGFRYFDGEVHIELEFQRPLPKSAPKRDNGKPDTSRPDLDNLCKSVLDALNGVAWRDDAQITRLKAAKKPRLKMAANAILIDITYWKETE